MRLPTKVLKTLLRAKDLNLINPEPGMVNKLLDDLQSASSQLELERRIHKEDIRLHRLNRGLDENGQLSDGNILLNALKRKSTGQKLDEQTSFVLQKGDEEFKRLGLLEKVALIGNGFALPSDYCSRSTLLASSIAGEGVNLNVSPLEEKLIAVQAGAKFLTGIQPNLNFPNPSSIQVTAAGEAFESADGGLTLGKISFKPRLRLSARVDVSKTVIQQGGPEVESLLYNLILAAVASKLENFIFGVAGALSTTIQGMGYKCTSGTMSRKNSKAPTFDDLLALEEEVNNNGSYRGKLGFITSGKGAIILKKKERIAGMGFPSLLENDLINGYPAYFSNNVSNAAGTDGAGSLLIFGDWSQLAIVQFGGYVIEPDPFSLATLNILRINVNAFFDVKGLRGAASTDNSDVTAPDDYAIAFASIPIKLS